jgi:starch phosphorylase
MSARSPRIPHQPVSDIELPKEFERLYDLAYNLWWGWSEAADRLFAMVDQRAWSLYRNPVQLLIGVEPSHWEPLRENETFIALYREVVGAFDIYMNGVGESWFGRHHAAWDGGPIAYFCCEYGVHQSLALYSGGLGVLAGDHCKSASDLGLPFVAVGLLYRNGYFRQTVDADGHQQHFYPEYDFTRLALRPAAGHTGRDVKIEVPLPGRTVVAKIWAAQVGRVPLLLLDTDVAENHSADRAITNILYVRGREMRLAQEVVLGVGGVRALRALGIAPSVWHINEGHSALLQIERMREEIEGGATLASARKAITPSTVFTTHTPVPAGNEQFEAAIARPYLEALAAAAGSRLKVKDLVALGHADHGESDQPLNLTAMALHTAGFANGVSRLNAEVSRKMWWQLLGASDAESAPISAITNGVHTETWVGPEMLRLYERHMGPAWRELLLEPAAWQAIHAIPDAEVWRTHEAQKERLGRFARARLRETLSRHGRSPEELRAVDELFDPKALTIGFARRFATYKRADLFFSDLHRLRAIVASHDRPLQIVYAGKAHPADRPGQELIQHIFRLSQSESLRGRVFFIEDYDMRVARMIVQGVDVWLNTPRRPMEASGTSGMKAALNGALNFSVLDGWWPESYDGKNGFVIGDEESLASEADQDRKDANALYTALEEELVPSFYKRAKSSGVPADWVGRMKASIASIAPLFSSHRMVRDYAEQAYLPAMAAGRREPVTVG